MSETRKMRCDLCVCTKHKGHINELMSTHTHTSGSAPCAIHHPVRKNDLSNESAAEHIDHSVKF